MKIGITLLLASAAMLPAQENPLSTETKQAFNAIKNNLIKMAEKMPEDAYGFKPVPEIRTFGGLVGHVADSEMRTCSTINGEAKQLGASKMTAKAELVAALKSASEECDKAYGALTDAAAVQMIEGPRGGKRSKLGMLVGNTTHANEEYGYMAVYLRLKGIVPPSSEGR
jgi:DinB superfamily